MPPEHRIKKIIFKVYVGSHLYGLNRPESDKDFMSVFIPPEEYILGLKHIDEIDYSTKKSNVKRKNSSDDIDDKAYNIQKFLKLLLQNNPNIVEVLFAEPRHIIHIEPEFQELMDNYDKIISQRVFRTFTGYAYSQRKHLAIKRKRFESLDKAIKYIEHICIKPRDITELEASNLNQILEFYKGEKGNTEHFHKGMHLRHIYDRIKHEFDMYGYRVRGLNFTGNGGDSYDSTFAYHIIRLLDEGRQLLETGRIKFPISGKARDDIIRIRDKEVPFDELMKLYDEYNSEIKKIHEKTSIRENPDFNWANKYLVKTLKNNLM